MTEFEQVYELYFKDVYKYALSLTRNEALAEEITQETFFKALKSIDQFDGRCKVYVWLCQIAKNAYFTMYKKAKRNDDDLGLRFKTEETPEQSIIRQESVLEIHRILHRLPEPYKEVFSLRTFGELSFRQIGELFGKTESWARVTYHRAKLKIKEELP
ncbi:MAG: RNA polymerase sigma factor [Lachnospiraceae bacterium]|nr:RNA polymerase sigma factor [Lachnospiraceae bacterium]